VPTITESEENSVQLGEYSSEEDSSEEDSSEEDSSGTEDESFSRKKQGTQPIKDLLKYTRKTFRRMRKEDLFARRDK
jgi:hypothetical protein